MAFCRLLVCNLLVFNCEIRLGLRLITIYYVNNPKYASYSLSSIYLFFDRLCDSSNTASDLKFVLDILDIGIAITQVSYNCE